MSIHTPTDMILPAGTAGGTTALVPYEFSALFLHCSYWHIMDGNRKKGNGKYRGNYFL